MMVPAWSVDTNGRSPTLQGLVGRVGSLDFVLEAIESLLKPLGLSFYSTVRTLRWNKFDPFIYICIDLTL